MVLNTELKVLEHCQKVLGSMQLLIETRSQCWEESRVVLVRTVC